jgi:hypothetical protein
VTPHSTHSTPVRRLHEEQDRYRHGVDRPLTGYIGLLATYTTLTAGATLLARRSGRMGRPKVADMALLAVTTFRISRLLAKDSVTGAVRAPFTEYREAAGEGEVNEDVTDGTGWRHAVGELLTCPFCLGQWVATAATTSMVVAPDLTRFAGTICATGVASDLLQLGWSKAKDTLA